MINKSIFINQAINDALDNYVNKKLTEQKISAVDFTTNIIKTLMFIYSESEILNTYNQKDETRFDAILLQYGFPSDALKVFYQQMQEFSNWQKQNSHKTFLITEIQKTIIEMIKYKSNVFEISDLEIQTYEELLYLNGTREFYNKTNSINPDEVKFFWNHTKSNLNNLIVINRVRPEILSPQQYETYGLSISEIKKLDDSQIEKINKEILKNEIENIGVNGGNTKQKEDVLQYVLKPQNITSGAGFVDKLLLFGIISIIAIIAYLSSVLFGR